jgi:uncharacterized protein YajQ (UPF0234 family)
MAEQNSFDVVSKVDMQEVKNAVDQALKEISQRFDFKGTKTELTLKEKEGELVIVSDDDYKIKSVVDILRAKLIKRSVSVKAFSFGNIEPALGGTVRQVAKIQNGLSSEKAKEIAKEIRDAKFKAQAQIQGDQVRVLSKSRDDLQLVIGFLKGKDFGVDLQFINYR